MSHIYGGYNNAAEEKEARKRVNTLFKQRKEEKKQQQQQQRRAHEIEEEDRQAELNRKSNLSNFTRGLQKIPSRVENLSPGAQLANQMLMQEVVDLFDFGDEVTPPLEIQKEAQASLPRQQSPPRIVLAQGSRGELQAALAPGPDSMTSQQYSDMNWQDRKEPKSSSQYNSRLQKRNWFQTGSSYGYSATPPYVESVVNNFYQGSRLDDSNVTKRIPKAALASQKNRKTTGDEVVYTTKHNNNNQQETSSRSSHKVPKDRVPENKPFGAVSPPRIVEKPPEKRDAVNLANYLKSLNPQGLGRVGGGSEIIDLTSSPDPFAPASSTAQPLTREEERFQAEVDRTMQQVNQGKWTDAESEWDRPLSRNSIEASLRKFKKNF